MSQRVSRVCVIKALVRTVSEMMLVLVKMVKAVQLAVMTTVEVTRVHKEMNPGKEKVHREQ